MVPEALIDRIRNGNAGRLGGGSRSWDLAFIDCLLDTTLSIHTYPPERTPYRKRDMGQVTIYRTRGLSSASFPWNQTSTLKVIQMSTKYKSNLTNYRRELSKPSRTRVATPILSCEGVTCPMITTTTITFPLTAKPVGRCPKPSHPRYPTFNKERYPYHTFADSVILLKDSK